MRETSERYERYERYEMYGVYEAYKVHALYGSCRTCRASSSSMQIPDFECNARADKQNYIFIFTFGLACSSNQQCIMNNPAACGKARHRARETDQQEGGGG